MANNISNMLNNRFRLTGMASGLDTESMVKQLMRVETYKVDKIRQGKDTLEWKRDNYREISNVLRGFQDEFFNYLKPSNNMRSLNTYNEYKVTSTSPSVATATGGAGVTNATHTIEVLELAKAATGSSTGAITKNITGNAINSFNVDGYNKTFIINYNGTSKEITIPNGSYTDAASVLGNGSDGKLQQLIEQAFNGNITVVDVGGKLQFNTVNATDVLTISTKYMPGDDLLNTLGVDSSGVGRKLNFTSPLEVKKGMKFEVSIVEDNAGVKETTTKVIQWDANKTYNNANELVADLQTRVDAEFGVSGKINITTLDDKLTFASGTGIESISLNNTDVVKNLGLQSGDSNKLSLSDTMEKFSNKLINGGITLTGGDKFILTINNVNIEVNKTDTLRSFIAKVNNSTAGVNLSYSTHSDTFNLAAKETGAGNITINDNGSNFFSRINLSSNDITAGQDASFKLDGLSGVRRTNRFSVDGVIYNLESKGITTISLTQNTDEVFNKIKSFVEKYNEILSKINGELNEKHERSYTPLTAEQKASMNEDDIKKWEEKAKTGLLRNDGILNGIVNNMRMAMSDIITDVSGGLSSIGISTGGYLEKGKLIINESTLKETIKNNPDKVMSIFAKESQITYSDVINGVASKKDRYNQNGIINRLNDILQDSIRSTRDKDGNKGILLEKAGIVGDLSEFKSMLSQEIDKKTILIDQMAAKLFDKENKYYQKFAALEKAMSQMNSQSSWLAQQFGGANN